MTTHAHWFGALCASLAWTLTSPCHAQSPTKAVLHVRGSEPGLTYEFAPRRQRAETPRCSDPCEVIATPGKYELRVFRGEEKLGTSSVTILRSADLRVSPPDTSASQGGLAMGIVGSGLFAGGLIAISIAALSQICESEHCGDHTTTLQLGLAAFVGGAVLAPIGWVMFAKNRRPHVEILPPSGRVSPQAATNDLALRFGVGAGSFSAALTF